MRVRSSAPNSRSALTKVIPPLIGGFLFGVINNGTIAAQSASPDDSQTVRGQDLENEELFSLAPQELNPLPGESFDSFLGRRAESLNQGVERSESWITSIALQGSVVEKKDGTEEGVCRLRFGLQTRGRGPYRIQIGLNGLNLREATTGTGRLVEWQNDPEQGWWLILEDPIRTPQFVDVDVIVDVEAFGGERLLEFKLPPAPETKINLKLPYEVETVFIGEDDLRPVLNLPDGSQLDAILKIGDPVRVRWEPPEGTTESVAPLLLAEGHRTLAVGPGSLTTRSTWEVRAFRGVVSELIVRLDPATEFLETKVNGILVEPIPVSETGTSTSLDRLELLRIPLADPLDVGESTTIRLESQRPLNLESAGPQPILDRGHWFEGVTIQEGTLSISAPERISVRLQPPPGLNPISPRALPEEARSLDLNEASIVHAFRFDSPVDALMFQVARKPSMIVIDRLQTQIEFDFESGLAQVLCQFTAESEQGPIEELRVLVPDGLRLDRVEPTEGFPGWSLEQDESTGETTLVLPIPPEPDAEARKSIVVDLSGQVGLPVAGNQFRDQELTIPLFQPTAAVYRSVTVVARAPQGITLGSKLTTSRKESLFDHDTLLPALLDDRPYELKSRFRIPPPAISIVARAQGNVVHREVDLQARVGLDGLGVQQTVTLHVLNGELAEAVLEIPEAIERRWELRTPVDRNLPLEPGASGEQRRRLVIRPISAGSSIKLSFVYQIEPPEPLVPGKPFEFEIPEIEVRTPGHSSATRLKVAAPGTIQLQPEGNGWRRLDGTQAVADPSGGAPVPLQLSKVLAAGIASVRERTPRLTAVVSPQADLPSTLASRLYLRTEQATNGSVRVTAFYRMERFQDAIGVRLNPVAVLDQVSLDGRSLVSGVVRDPERPGDFWVRPTGGASTESEGLLELRYRVPRSADSDRWRPPQLLDDGTVLDSLWEIRLPSSLAMIGTPIGYSDENRWAWSGFGRERQPWKTEEELLEWVNAPLQGTKGDESGTNSVRFRFHSYLFATPGEPDAINPLIAPYALVIGCCSGGVFFAGMLALSFPGLPRRLIVAALVLTLGGLSVLGPATSILLAESSVIGLCLIPIAGLIRRAVDRRRPISQFPDGSSLGTFEPNPISDELRVPSAPTPAVGSDDSTAIRSRPPIPPSQGPNQDAIIEIKAPVSEPKASETVIK